MPWTTPASYSVGEVVTASKLNTQVRDNLEYLKGLDGVIVFDNTINPQLVNVGTASTAVAYVKIGAGVTTARNAYLDIINEIAYPDYAFRLVRYNSANSDTEMLHRGTGVFRLATLDGAPVQTRGGGPGGFTVWGFAGLSTTPVTVLLTGVNRRVSGLITAWHSGGTGGGTSFAVGTTAGTSIYNDGTNSVSIAISGGQMTIFRSAGSGTFDVVLAFCYQ